MRIFPWLVAALAAAAATLPGAAAAGTYCRSTKTVTYCDDGTTFYRYGNRIQSSRGDSWTRFGAHISGSDGSWFADHGDSVTSSLPDEPDPLSTGIVLRRLFGDDPGEE